MASPGVSTASKRSRRVSISRDTQSGPRYCEPYRLVLAVSYNRLSKFSWGHGFYKMNSHLIERYRKCHTAAEVQAEQEAIQAEMEDEARERKARKGTSRMTLVVGQHG